MDFLGYRRKNGAVGTRNHVLVMSSVSCANGVVQAIGRELPDVKIITHTEGCGRATADVLIARRTLAGLGRNPNVAAVLLVGLGCESIKVDGLAEAIGEVDKPVETIVIQDAGGSVKATAAGIGIARRMLVAAAQQRREPCPLSELTVGMECGGSDALSGLTANCLVGAVADWLVAAGATAILSETTEMIGTETILAKRAADPRLASEIVDLIQGQRRRTEELLGERAGMVISPGNMDGGLSTITEKSMGCIVKGGTTPIQELVAYGQAPSKKGLVLMDTPGSDIFSLTGMAAGGAQLMLFTTGRGTPAGFPTVPVVKIASNSRLFASMTDDMDFDAGTLIEGRALPDAREELIGLVQAVAAGQTTQAERNGQEMVAIHTTGPAF
ncbi:UxaA family hydrolase [Desulfatitalea tepidiphila]|uniref:UxaA family hydrolase n=1 Tax=Desulfatitalea tepidiphila TaxID=1185843 RepID=UPI0006B4DF4A|nr:UxaA family hydrolase [Desulfatitalea tepidiphila]